jgi:CRP-like cAMP-binding protein
MDRYEKVTAGNLLFKTLDQNARENVVRLAEVERYDKGTVIIKQGDSTEDIYLLREGVVDVRYEHDGKSDNLNTLGPGTIFGEVAEVAGMKRTATVVALMDVEVLRFDGAALVKELRKHPTASKLLNHITLHRAEDTISKIEEMD